MYCDIDDSVELTISSFSSKKITTCQELLGEIKKDMGGGLLGKKRTLHNFIFSV